MKIINKAGSITVTEGGMLETTEMLPKSFCVISTAKATDMPTNILSPVFCSLIGPNKKDIARRTREKVTNG